MIRKTQLPVIPIKIEDKDYFVLLDSGSDVSYIDSNIVKEINATVVGKQGSIIGGTSVKEDPSLIYEISFKCGEKLLTDKFTSNDFNEVFGCIEELTGVKLIGILGTAFMLRYKCILDFDKLAFFL